MAILAAVVAVVVAFDRGDVDRKWGSALAGV